MDDFDPLSNMLMGSSFLLVLIAAIVGFFTLLEKIIFQKNNKEIKSSSLSLPSPSAYVSKNWEHHVFPSFHGADVRKTFLSHILVSFRRKGIHPFIDNQIEKSKSIGSKLIEAIRGSKIAIVLLSKNYASSSWCLDELVEIIKCREDLSQIVMTIFYEVDPTDVRKQTGEFGKAFRKSCKGKPKEHIDIWRKALEDVAKIAGEHSRNWDNEAAMIEKITTDVSNMLNISTPSRDFDNLVGMRAHMEEMKQLLCLDWDEVKMIGIWGPPGIGKTTFARFLFNHVSNRFQIGTIMVNIKGCYPRPCLDEYNAQLQLQTQMLSQIINQKDIMISHLGVAQERLKDKKVLLILDDVDQLGQLLALAEETRWFGPGSRIIITTEDRGILKAHRIEHIYKMKSPSSEEAFQIFCMYAFGQQYPYDEFYELACEVTSLAGELPLGLKVLGSALRGMSKQEWKRTLPRLRKSLDGETESIIKFSYDALYDEEKDLFLYIACIFEWYSVDVVEELLAKKFSDIKQSIHILVEKSFISIDGRLVVFKVHSLLAKFGRETSRKQFVHGIAKRQLLIDARDICDDTIDSRKFIVIMLRFDRRSEELNLSEKAIERMTDLQFVNISDDIDGVGPYEKLYSVLHHSQRIRSLRWYDFRNTCFPSTFNPEFLVEIEIYGSKLQKLWEGTKPLKNLKLMNLSYSKDLKELPDLSTATNLKSLALSDCSNIVKLPTIENETTLETLFLRNCSSLVELPPSIGIATNIKTLHISGCSNLIKLPFSIEDMTNLKTFDISDCSSMVELPLSIGTATTIETLNISGCSSLLKLPFSIGDLTNFKSFDLSDCSSVVELPPSIGYATNIETLNISGCSTLVELPSFFGDMTSLREFRLSNCTRLLELPPSIVAAKNLEILDLSRCSNLVKLPSSIENLQQLEKLSLCGCLKLEALPTNINLQSLDTLELRDCTQLIRFPEISTQIKYLALDGTAIKEVPLSIMSWPRLSNFHMSYFESLAKFPHALDIITELVLGSTDIREIASWVKGLSHLRVLKLHNCNNLVSLPQLSDSLTCIDADNCKSLERLDCSFNNPEICLIFTNCFKLNQKARDLIMHTSTNRYAVLHGTQVPTCFNFQATTGGSLRFKACITLVKDKEKTRDDDFYIKIKNKLVNVNRPVIEHIYTYEVEARKVISKEVLFEFHTHVDGKWGAGKCRILQVLEVRVGTKLFE